VTVILLHNLIKYCATNGKFTLICLPLNSDSSSAIASSTLSFSANSIYANLHNPVTAQMLTANSAMLSYILSKC